MGAPTSSGSSNGFGRGQSACFFLSSVPLGELQELVIWHDSSGPQPAWHLAYVEVTELTGGKVSRQCAAPVLLLIGQRFSLSRSKQLPQHQTTASITLRCHSTYLE